MEHKRAQGSMKLYTTEEIAALFKVHYKTVLRWIKLGKLPATKIGRRYYISEEDLQQLLQKK